MVNAIRTILNDLKNRIADAEILQTIASLEAQLNNLAGC